MSTPVTDSRRAIVNRALRISAFAVAGSILLYGAELFSAVQIPNIPVPALGIEPEEALLAVSVFALVVVGIVLSDKRPVFRSSLVDAEFAASTASLHKAQAAALILSETLVGVSVLIAFIGASALIRGIQVYFTSKATPFDGLILALVVAGIAWVFVLIAAANTRSPAEAMAMATYEEETYDVAANHRGVWQTRWLRHATSSSPMGILTDTNLAQILRSVRAASWKFVGLFLAYTTAVFLAFFVVYLTVSTNPYWSVLSSVPGLFARALGAACIVGTIGATACFPVQRAFVAGRNARWRRSVALLIGSLACVMASTMFIQLAYGLLSASIVSLLHVLSLIIVWILHNRSERASVTMSQVGRTTVDSGLAGQTSIYLAVREELRDFPMPRRQEQRSPSHSRVLVLPWQRPTTSEQRTNR
ncbi:hypothetical protein E3T61_12185 [Cryobacterium lactosi]|uniref:Uncharacterized protein n=1 Tax=Cryobacterium lactosi TaxID=1259202 RepID=A0A4R9BRT0_9MICO|nr:hypothetical protein [Cryobacterium lactosi]TFD88582.1 hypothetical protein E3T61_12185 [Cryobacterium lactosi]